MKKDIKYINESLDFAKFTNEDVKMQIQKVEQILKDDLSYFKDLDDKDLTFKNVFAIPDEKYGEVQRICGVLNLFTNIHTDSTIRESSRVSSLKIGDLLTAYAYNEVVYQKVISYYNKNFKKERSKLTQEETNIVLDSIKGYKKMGMHLPKDQKKQLVAISNKLNKLSSGYQLNSTKNYNKGTWFSKEELVGLEESQINTFKFDEEKKKYYVSIRPTEILEVKKFVTNKKTRQKITSIAESGVGEKNNKILREILLLRAKKAKILGYKTWGHLTMSEQMVSDPVKATKFCTDLLKNLSKKYELERKEASQFLLKGEKIDTTNNLFLEHLAQKKAVQMSSEDLKKYFEYEHTIKSMFSIWEKFFGVKVNFLRSLNEINEDISVYTCSDSRTGEMLGTFILDLFPRDGKYGHACVELNSPRFVDVHGNIHTATGTLICNFTKNKKGKTLITMENVATLFHEGGHLLHLILSENNYTGTSAFSTSIDFVEIPSQFMEHFVTSPKTTSLVSKHVETGKTFDKKILEKIHKLDDYFAAYMWTRLCVISLFDLTIHGKDILKYANKKGEMNKLFEKLWAKYIKTKPTNKRDFSSNFAHLVGGYDSKYYGYGVSRVYAEDVWTEFINKNKKSGYKKFLQMGGKDKEENILKEFLGRNPTQAAFLKFINS